MNNKAIRKYTSNISINEQLSVLGHLKMQKKKSLQKATRTEYKKKKKKYVLRTNENCIENTIFFRNQELTNLIGNNYFIILLWMR